VAKFKSFGEQDIPRENLFNVPFSSTIFNNGDIVLQTNLTSRVVKEGSDFYTETNEVSLEDLKVTSIKEAEKLNKINTSIKLNFDKSNVENYSYFGSLKELLNVSVRNIITNFPGSLYINFFYQGSLYPTVKNYFYNSDTNISTFNVNGFLITNNFELNYVKNNSLTSENTLKDLNISYLNYEIFDGTNSYPLLGFTGTTSDNSGTLSLKVKGNSFSEIPSSASTIVKSFHIRPNLSEQLKFLKTRTPIESYLLSTDTDVKYTASFKIPSETEDGTIVYNNKDLTWSVSDGYNIDINTSSYGNYFVELMDIGKAFDDYKTDKILRMLIPSSFRDMDLTDDQKSEKILRIYGREFDETKRFIDSLAYVNNISYDKKENVPDVLVKNLAKTFGWQVFNIVNENDLVNSILSVSNENYNSSQSPAELDIELWRRILLNTNWFFKSKGTRKAIEVIFEFIGAPTCLVDFNEYIYTVNGKINTKSINPTIIKEVNDSFTTLPYDENGYPKAPNENTNFHFQVSGNTDSGQHYIDLYRKLGFKVTKTVDNKKSWVQTGSTIRIDERTNTKYKQNDSKLILNTKEISLSFDLAKAIECDVYNYNLINNYPVSSPNRPFPYPQLETNNIDVTTLSFSEYVQEVYSKFIDVRNRKTSSDANTGGYPTLYKLYEDYLTTTTPISNRRTIKNLNDYLNKLNGVWGKFINQLIPATTIISDNGIKIRNTIFTPQKFTYKHGIDEGSEFAVKQPETFSDKLNLFVIQTEVSTPITAKITTYQSFGNYNYSKSGNLGGNSNIKTFTQILNLWANQRFDSNICGMSIPTFTMNTSTAKIASSAFTQSIVHYYDETPTGKTLTFNFIGDTTSLTGSTSQFGYNIHKYIPLTSGFSRDSSYTKEFPLNTFTATTIVNDVVANSVMLPDSEYLVKGYYTKTCLLATGSTIIINEPYNTYENYDINVYPKLKDVPNFFDRSKYNTMTGITINTISNFANLGSYPYNIYEEQFDYWYVSVGSPKKPIYTFGVQENETVINNNGINYYTELINISEATTAFTITYEAKGDLQVNVGGLTLIKDVEYVKNNLGIPSLNKRYELKTPISASLGDVLTVSYIADFATGDISLMNENLTVTTINSGTTPTILDKVYFNNSTNQYEYFMNSGVTSSNDIYITVNGITLQPTTDYDLSVSNNKKIIFYFTLLVGDIINVYYTINVTNILASDTVFLLNTNPYLFNWQIPIPIQPKEVGEFILEFTNVVDTTFSSIVYSTLIQYNSGQSFYSKSIDFLTASPLILGKKYRYRVKSNRYYTTITNNIVTSTTYSDSVILRLPS